MKMFRSQPRINPWMNLPPITPEQGIINFEKIYKNLFWIFGIGIICSIDLIIFIICLCVIDPYHVASYWTAFGILLAIYVLLAIPASVFYNRSQRISISMPMPYRLRVKLANINQGMYFCAGILPIIGIPFCIWCIISMKKLIKEAKEKVSKNEPYFVNETPDQNNPFNQGEWWQKKQGDQQ